MPPNVVGSTQPQLEFRCIDSSNIFVICNDEWYWAGPRRGWLPTVGGISPLPRDIWPDKVFNLPQPLPSTQWRTVDPYSLPPWNQFNNIPRWNSLQFVM